MNELKMNAPVKHITNSKLCFDRCGRLETALFARV